jgi:hypothetical protein
MEGISQRQAADEEMVECLCGRDVWYRDAVRINGENYCEQCADDLLSAAPTQTSDMELVGGFIDDAADFRDPHEIKVREAWARICERSNS